MKIDLIAKLKNIDEFKKNYIPGDEKKLYDNKSLIYYALSNSDLASRYYISNFLLEKDVDVLSKNKENETVLHVLLGQTNHSLEDTYKLCKEFINKGVDINALDKKNRLALQWLINLKYTDEELVPFYKLWFAQDFVDFQTQNKFGVSPYELAKKQGHREKLLERMNEYDRND
ncbi:hypothetical protein EDD63_1627 [Breznakia blatticola]|uniref:Uncharacterized protein n=1 Tax=Breznakia blatticola TaxID=1754012 RepID=A0A4R7ZA86_9FIRM|nr:ankyrin repeat domain-containing protein [Breznakia blatticola]TDW09194.1 hypothetical protein EDD63_1627 [Breznakia blatticola]